MWLCGHTCSDYGQVWGQRLGMQQQKVVLVPVPRVQRWSDLAFHSDHGSCGVSISQKAGCHLTPPFHCLTFPCYKVTRGRKSCPAASWFTSVSGRLRNWFQRWRFCSQREAQQRFQLEQAAQHHRRQLLMEGMAQWKAYHLGCVRKKVRQCGSSFPGSA